MRITKDAAKSIAIKLTEKKTKELNRIRTEISDITYNVALKQVPKDILDLHAKKPNYFKTFYRVYLTGKGLNHECIDIKNVPGTDGYSKTILVDDKNASALATLINNRDTLISEIEKLKIEIEAALIGLGTYAKITSEFKEAVPFLPFKEKNELVINIKDIRKKLL